MKRQLSKFLVDQAKLDLREKIIKRIVKDVSAKGCWHLKSVNESKIVDAVCHFRDRGTKKIFFKARRLVFELIKGDLPEGFTVYQNCEDKYCVNPDHHYATTRSDYLGILKLKGVNNRRSGFKHKPETLIKMSECRKGKKPSELSRLKMRLARLGIDNRSPEVIERCSELYYRGEKNVTAKLTNEQVLEIRRLEKSCSASELAKHYPVAAKQIRAIWRRICWKHL